jgi:hypothetical protein
MGEISWIDRVKNKEILHAVKEERNILHTIKRRKSDWIGYISFRNCILIHVIEGKIGGIETAGRRGRRLKQLLDKLKERTGYWKLKEEVPGRTLWRSRFGMRYGTFVGQTTR